MQLTRLLAALCSVAVALGATIASADRLPAVSGQNAKLSFEGGRLDDETGGVALGSYTIPLGPSIGFQVDGTLGLMNDDVLGGVGAHLFTRNPERYLFGLFTSYHSWNSIDIWRVAAETELYLDRFSISGLAGYEGLHTPAQIGGLEVIQPDKSRFFSQVDLGYYLTDDLKVFAGYRFQDNVSFGGAGAEYMLRTGGTPVSLFARGNFGESDHTSFTGGFKVYLGGDPDKSLIKRHRMDDPEIYVPVFPKLVTKTPVNQSKSTAPSKGPTLCSVDIEGKVMSPSGGACTCPSGTAREGTAPESAGADYFCNPV
jgi:hypothetical protein